MWQEVLKLLQEHEVWEGKRYYEIRHWCKESNYLIRFTKDVLLVGDKNGMTIYSPVKNQYKVENETFIAYEDLDKIEIRHVPFLAITFRLKNMNTRIVIQCPIKGVWGLNVKELPVYCEDRCKDTFINIKEK